MVHPMRLDGAAVYRGGDLQRRERLQPPRAVGAADVAAAVGGGAAVRAHGGEQIAQVGARDGSCHHANDAAHHAHGQPHARLVHVRWQPGARTVAAWHTHGGSLFRGT